MASARMPDELAQAFTLAVSTGLMTGGEVYRFAFEFGDDWWLAAARLSQKNAARSWYDTQILCQEISELTNRVMRTHEPSVRV